MPDQKVSVPPRAWAALVFCLVLVVAILVFILQNLGRVSVHFLGLRTRMALGVALLLGAVMGGLVVLCLAAGRIHKLRSSRPRR